jgi:hypothetical protein
MMVCRRRAGSKAKPSERPAPLTTDRVHVCVNHADTQRDEALSTYGYARTKDAMELFFLSLKLGGGGQAIFLVLQRLFNGLTLGGTTTCLSIFIACFPFVLGRYQARIVRRVAPSGVLTLGFYLHLNIHG